MPSKRTNDSVDRILEDLNIQQAQAGLRDSVTDHQVDEILRSVGISTAPAQPVQGGFAFEADDDLGALLNDPGPAPSQAAPQPRQAASAPRPVQPAPQPTAPQTRPAAPATQPPRQDLPMADTGTTTFSGDTTGTGIIKGFLVKMAPEGSNADSDALNLGKNQFQKFFKNSVAVVPDEKGRLREPGKKKRGLFGMKYADDTGEFVPINVSLGGGSTAPKQPTPEPPAQEEYYPDEEPAPARQPAAKKHGFFGGLFGGEGETEELMIPEERVEEPTLSRPAVTQPAPAEDTSTQEVCRSKYTRPARRAAEETENRTLERIQSTVGYAQQHPAPPSNSGATGTIYRKKRNTVEFTPGQKIQTTPPPQPMPQHVGEPVGEPIETPRNQPAQPPVSTGFTMQMDALDAKPVDSTQEFMSAYNAVRRPRPAAQPAPAPRPAPAPQPAPAQPAHTGFTQNLGTVQPVPARPAQAHSGYTQDLAGPAPAEPNTSAFVSDIANAINSEKEDTAQYAAAAARLTASLAEDAGATRTRARIPTAADVKKAAARLTGPAADEGDDNTVSPFDTAEIPVPHSREYERAEDAPAVRAELAKRLTRATIGCIAAGVAAAVMIVLAVLPARPAALNDATVYPAVMLVLLLAACAANWQTFLSGFKGLAKMPTPDSLAILPALGAAIQCIVLLATGGYTGTLPMMTGPAALVLCLNAVGRRLNAVTVSENFQLVSAKVEHSVAYRLKDAGALKAVSQGLAEPHPSVLVSRPTQIFRSFLTNSAAHGTSDKNQQQFAWVLAACGAAAFLFTVISTKNAATAATAMAGVFCLAAPLAGTLLSALPARMMQRSAAQVGAVIPGWRDIRQLGRINVIQVTARDLFPAGCVTLAGIKPVKPEHIDTAIVYAASILSEAGPTLRDVFMNMLGENRSLLAKVDDRETVYGKGYVGWVNKRRVLVGNRALMQDYGIKIPSLEYEQHHTVNQRRVIYLAVSGKLFAMFQVAYQRDPDTAAVLETLHHNGLSLVVDCDDFNCDVKLLETAYSLPAGSVKVLSSAEHQAMAPAVAWLPESEGNMLHLGSFASFVGGLEAASGAAEGEHKSAIVLTVSVLLSCVVGVLLTLTGGLVTLPLPGIVLYQAAWCVLALIFPLLQRY
ncbi:hypothetical protein [Gemmiger sp.]|uniref:hypothetical protein n=1 Tax=Gemmiger sp. TaxID=2049027 RepID=UPI003AB60152